MSNKKEASINNVSKYLIEKFNAIEISKDDFLNKSKCVYEDILDDVVKIYKIDDENMIQSLLSENEKSEIQITIEHLKKNNLMENEDKKSCSLYMNEISTGKLIIVILQSEDKINLSGFIMEGNGQILYDYLISLMNEPIEKSSNSLDEVIEELNHFRPYGKYFK